MAQDFKKYSDDELYTMVCSGGDASRAAFEELYARHSPRVFVYCFRVLGDRDRAEDIFQETFLRFYKSMEADRTMTNVAAYILRIARNLCLNEKRRKYNDRVDFEEVRFPVHDSSYESAELLKLVETALELLGEEYRESFVLREFLGLSYEEIAEIVDSSQTLVRVRIHRAKSRIREILAPYIKDLQT